ncbi:hypothetical protein JAAARDRAFT_155715 [Jaapia argillacea MUCL 33604]|uniref:Peptidase M48 domain-containing protein n=1 Tax=Jaapia argillacea MUCL 33604 TaxID=933084 RepID=A0A067Q621_9AGAM|nr:hypothetical protein JAAARDRAFT_155715 [Jaapia argillacea MUCL 33604]
MKIFAVFIGGSAVYYFVHLEQVPETGRWRFMDINPKFETRLAQEAQAELVREFHGKVLPPNHPLTRHVRRVVTRILDSNNLGHLKDTEAPFLASQANRDSNGTEGGDHPDDWVISGLRRGEEVAPGAGGREWNLMVVNDDKVVNAMATYGNVIVFTGILPVCKDEQGLAAVLGHEIGHVVARHASENYSRMKILLFVATLLNIAGLDFGFSRLLTKLLVDLPNSRLMETEADKIGLRLSAKACYDPRAAPEVFTRMGQLEKAQGRINLDFLYTHPASSKRVEALNEMLHEAYAIQAATPECGQTTSYMEAFRDVFGSVKSPISSGAEWRFN